MPSSSASVVTLARADDTRSVAGTVATAIVPHVAEAADDTMVSEVMAMCHTGCGPPRIARFMTKVGNQRSFVLYCNPCNNARVGYEVWTIVVPKCDHKFLS